MSFHPPDLFGLVAGHIADAHGWEIHRRFDLIPTDALSNCLLRVTLSARKELPHGSPLSINKSWVCDTLPYSRPGEYLRDLCMELEAGVRHDIREIEDLETAYRLPEKTER